MRDPRVNPKAGDSLYINGSRYDVMLIDDAGVTVLSNDQILYCSIACWNDNFKNSITEIKGLK